jgi:hypothetical protein
MSLRTTSPESTDSRPVLEEVRVEPDLERLARERHGQGLGRLADVRASARSR